MYPMPRTREDILQERRQLKAKYGDLFDSAAALLFRHGPVGINFEVNHDEYQAEVGSILPRLHDCQSADDKRLSAIQDRVNPIPRPEGVH